MLDWFKKEDGTANTNDRTTGGNTVNGSLEPLAVLTNKKKTLALTNIPCTLGKNGDEADVSFFHDSVGNVHCRFDCKNRQFTITDLGSPAGTQVNGQRLKPGLPCTIDNGFKLVIGKVKFDITINYEELARREREAALEEQRNAQPKEKTYTVNAREVNSYEYEESEVVYISCGLEPLKKKAKYTQEISAQEIRKGISAAAGQASAAPQEFKEPVYRPTPTPEPSSIPLPQVEEVKKPAPAPEPVRPPQPKKEEKPDLMLCLTLQDNGTGLTEEVMIDHFPFKIGRKASMNDHVIKMDGISREHLSISESKGIYYVTDLHSTNGVKVNGVKIPPDSEYRISPGDTIKISKRIYTVGMKQK